MNKEIRFDKKWHNLSIEKTAEALGTHLKRGLTSEEASARLERYGPNELVERPRPGFLRMLLSQFANFLVLILLVSCLVSFFLGEYWEAGAIMAIVVLNAILGVVQESKAEEALAALKKMAAPVSKVIRDGLTITVPAREIVPGDLIVLEAGNYVPADVRLVESINLKVEEAPLTGESVPVEKRADAVLDPDVPLGDRYNSAFMGTMVTYGRGKGIVVATGMRTEMGLIAEMIQYYEEEPTPLQVKLNQLGRWLGTGCLAICAMVFLVGVIRGVNILEMFMTSVSLAIAAVPEGLPAVVTICLALGMQEMVKRNALIRKLPAVETLGSATAICSDKTGTLTKNEMTAVTIYADGSLITIKGEGYEPEGGFYDENERPIEIEDYPEAKLLLLGATLCNDARLEKSRGEKTWRMVGDPTEGALVVAAAKAGLWKEELEERWPRVAEVPFDSMRKRMTTVHKIPMTDDQIPIINDSITKSLFLLKSRISRAKSILSEIRLNSGEKIGHWSSDIGNYSYVAFVKGAPDVVLELCTRIAENGEWKLSDKARERILERNASLASNALRVLGVAYRLLEELPTNPTAEGLEKDLTFIGLIGMIDPARPEVKDAIEVARRAGIKTVMVTGDYPNTAIAIAKELELLSPKGRVLVGTELDKLDDGTFASIVEEVEIYARVSPQHKVRIVEALKKRGHVVAMTGDGINDAPALKRASIGVAMGITGTDVTKETADMVLMDDNYASIVSAIEEGRVIYSNIRKFVYYLLSCNLGEIMTIFLATLRGWASPLSAIQLLWVNLVTDGAPALALGLEKGEPDIMELPPRPTKEPVINRKMTLGIAFQTIAITFATLAAYAIGLARFPEKARTMAFVTLSLSELLRAYTSRSERHSIFSIGVLSNKYMQLAVIASFSLLLAVVYLPFLRPIFDTLSLGLREWIAILPLLLIPAIIAEMMKFFLRGAWLTRRSSA